MITPNVNYDVEFVRLTQQIHKLSQKNQYVPKKLLLHACCAPCSTYCLTQVLPYFDVTLYYANDNITDSDEWRKRLQELVKLTDIVNDGKFDAKPIAPLKLVVQDFLPQRFFDIAKGLEKAPEGGARCEECFKLRLGDTFRYAADNGFDYFGTTLSVSPYKNSRLLNQIGLQLQDEHALWLPADFKKRNGYNQSVQLSNRYGLYRQHYCGCPFGKPTQPTSPDENR